MKPVITLYFKDTGGGREGSRPADCYLIKKTNWVRDRYPQETRVIAHLQDGHFPEGSAEDDEEREEEREQQDSVAKDVGTQVSHCCVRGLKSVAMIGEVLAFRSLNRAPGAHGPFCCL